MSKLSTNIIDTIKRGKLKPRPKYHFVALHILLWTALIISIVLGSIALSIIIRHFSISDWELARRATGSNVKSLIILIPYLWLGLTAGTLFIADLLFKKTEKGYKIRPLYIAIGSIALSLIGGLIIFTMRADIPIEKGLRQHVPPYARHIQKRQQPFVSPEKGILVGKITEIDKKKSIMIVDFKNGKWVVDIRNANIKSDIALDIGMRIGLMGNKTAKGKFKADRIRPWRYDRMRYNRYH